MERCEELEKKKDDHDDDAMMKARPPVVITYNYIDGVLSCPQCARTYTNKIGYASHSRAHQRVEQRNPNSQY
ncbi:unnamed protein product, partial [Brenthis ino]